jgi:hypothetical protein
MNDAERMEFVDRMSSTVDPGPDIRWAINVLLEKIAEKFEGWDTMDIWRSDAAMVVRSFKNDAVAHCQKCHRTKTDFDCADDNCPMAAHEVTEAHREVARRAMIKGYHDCGGGFQRVRSCDCDDSRIDGCKARVEAIAAAISQRSKT